MEEKRVKIQKEGKSTFQKEKISKDIGMSLKICIKDSADNSHLFAAAIEVNDITIRPNKDGYFDLYLRNIDNIFTIKIRAVGYKEYILRPFRINPEKYYEIDIFLSPDNTPLHR